MSQTTTAAPSGGQCLLKNQPKISLDETELKQPNVVYFLDEMFWKVLLVNVFGHQREILYHKRLNFREPFIE